MQNIVGIANQTNLLALNASIKASLKFIVDFMNLCELRFHFGRAFFQITEKDLPLLQMKSQNFPLASKNWWVM